jgi:Domain of unknown function (DUF4185)
MRQNAIALTCDFPSTGDAGVVRLAWLMLYAAGCSGPPSFGAKALEVGVMPQASTIQGRDGGPSGVVWGHSVWTFGDTVLNLNDVEGSNWHHNSFSITDDLDASDGIDGFSERLDAVGAPLYFLAPTADEDAFNTAHRGDPCAETPCGARWAAWPGPPIWDAPRNRALAFYGLIYAEPGDFNFHGVGQSVAVWNDFSDEPTRPSPSPGADHPTLLFQQYEPGWGTAAVIDGDLLYAFACDSDSNGLSPSCYLAEVPPESVLDKSAWRYWNGSSFVESESDKHELFIGAPSVTVQRSAHLGKWAAVYCQPLSNHVVIRTADAISGPWSDAKLLFDAKKDPAGAYDANWHPEYDDGATMYITFSRSNHMGWFGSEFALDRVTLP